MLSTKAIGRSPAKSSIMARQCWDQLTSFSTTRIHRTFDISIVSELWRFGISKPWLVKLIYTLQFESRDRTSRSLRPLICEPSLRWMVKLPATSPLAAADFNPMSTAARYSKRCKRHTTLRRVRETPNVQARSSTYRSTTACLTNRSGCL